MKESTRDRVFISYAHENLETVRRVVEGLRKRNLIVWFDKEHLRLGRFRRRQKIVKAITRTRHFVICISQSALRETGERPGFQDTELNTAYEIAQSQPDEAFTIAPVRLEDCDRGDFRLTSLQQYDLFHDFEDGLDKLAVDFGGVSLSDAMAKDERTKDEKLTAGLMGKATAAFYAGDYDKVITVINSVLSILPDYAAAWFNKGAVLHNLGRYEEALEAWEKGLEIKPRHVNAWTNKGFALGQLGRHEQALEAYEKALQIKPDYAEAWCNKGATLGRLGRYDEALEACDSALEIKPDYVLAWCNKGATLGRLGRYGEALEAYEKALQIKSDHVTGWLNKGAALSKLDRYEEALEALKKALQIKPHHRAALILKERIIKDRNRKT